MDTCADCGKPIGMTDPHYRRVAIDGGTIYHSACGDPFGIKAKAAENARLRAALQWIADQVDNEDGDLDDIILCANKALAHEQRGKDED